MDITFSCPHCEQSLVVDSSGRGNTILCPSCNRDILIPLDGEVAEPIQDTNLADMMATEQQRLQLDKLRDTARRTVEHHWRTFIILAPLDMKKAFKSLHDFDAMINEGASRMTEPEKSIYLQTIEAERQKLADEYDRNPDALKARLGISTSTPNYVPSYHRQTMDEMIVRTAVRATVWETIWAIFRIFR